MEFIAGCAIGIIAGMMLAAGAVGSLNDRDIERGWSYLSGEKYFLELDDDLEQR